VTTAAVGPALDAATLAAAAGPVAGLLPIAGGLQPRAVDPGTALGPDPAAAGWVAVRQELSRGALVLALAAPLANALRGDRTEDAPPAVLADLLAGPLAAVAATLGATPVGLPAELPAAEALGGLETSSTCVAAALGADDMDMGLLVLTTPGSDHDARGNLPPVAVPGQRPSHEEPPAYPPAPPTAGAPSNSRLDLLHAVDMEVTCELGRTRMTLRELLSLRPGTVVELDRAAGSPVDLLVNGTLLARGEVVVVDEEYGVRVTEIVTPGEGDHA
jgi:flagellar motor switch protein FliN/FliY